MGIADVDQTKKYLLRSRFAVSARSLAHGDRSLNRRATLKRL